MTTTTTTSQPVLLQVGEITSVADALVDLVGEITLEEKDVATSRATRLLPMAFLASTVLGVVRLLCTVAAPCYAL